MKIFQNNLYKLLITVIFYTILSTFFHTKALTQLPITVVIPSYNNSTIFKRNIDSVLSQNYSNYHVIYTDDCSPDATGDYVEQYINQHEKRHKVTVIKNEIRIGALHNLYRMIHSCNPNDIIIALDGDDWLPHEHVFEILNETYQTKNVWLTYGQFELYPGKHKGWASPMPDNIIKNSAFREYEHLPTHLRTFYAWLFQKIKLKDLFFLGDFYTMTWDMVMMFPMIEMAGERHHCFVDEILYVYNDINNISDHKISRQLQAHLAQIVRAKKRYTRLSDKPKPIDVKQARIDAIIFSLNAPEKLPCVISSLKNNVHGISDIHIIYQAPDNSVAQCYEEIQENFSACHFYKLAPNAADFRTQFINVCRQLQGEYVLFSKGDTKFIKPIKLTNCIQMLDQTKAYAFYFNLSSDTTNKNNSPQLSFVDLNNNMCAWSFYMARDAFSCANSVDCVLHKRDDILFGFVQAQYIPNPQGFELVWANQGNLDRVGLCFATAHTKIIEV